MIDERDETWRLIKAICEREIEELKEELTHYELEEDVLRQIQFEIKRLRWIIELPENIRNGNITIPDDQ